MYPYSEEGIARCLKETCQTESPVKPETFSLQRAEGGLNSRLDGEFYFETEDGKKYRMIVQGIFECAIYSTHYRWKSIESIEEVH